MLTNRLKYVLLDKGMNQTELATRTGLSRETISKIANGKVDPAISTCLMIADVLGVSVHEIWEIKKSPD